MTDEKGVGSLPDAGTIQPGDPGHIETHDEMARLVQVAADSLGVILDPPAPKPAVIGEYGHVDAHNTLLANIEQLAAAGGGSFPPGAAVIGGATGAVTESSFTGDGTNGDLGQAYDVYEFTGSGELVVSEPGFVDALVIGGGGAGGSAGGGGGAGGVLLSNDFYCQGGTETVTVGAGGVGRASRLTGANGESSSFVSLYGIGGGIGAAFQYTPLQMHGGSGGGGPLAAWTTPPRPTVGYLGTPGQGNDGGSSWRPSQNVFGSGGGGGIGARGENSDGGAGGGDGGAGDDYSAFTGQVAGTLVLAGGGGGGGRDLGGSGGSGIGGDGTAGVVDAHPGAQNTGSGGGGGGYKSDGGDGGKGGNGGSGIVIVRVQVASESYPFRTKTTAPKTAHAARIEDGIVRQVIVIPHLDDDDAKITEYCNRIGLPGTWVDTSYTGSRRGKYAGVGDTFVSTKAGGEFISPVVEETATADLNGEIE